MRYRLFSWIPLVVWVVLFYFIAEYHIASTHYNLFLLSLILSSFLILGIYVWIAREKKKGRKRGSG